MCLRYAKGFARIVFLTKEKHHIMLKEKVEKALLSQIEKEAYSSNLYLAMASWCDRNGFPGVAKWMFAQADEERMHMLKFMEFVNERGGVAVVPAIEQPPTEFESVTEIFNKTYEHEQFISESINQMVGVTMDERDFATHQWLQWFVTEQIEEESTVSAILDKVKLIGDTGNWYMFDNDIFAMRGAAANEA